MIRLRAFLLVLSLLMVTSLRGDDGHEDDPGPAPRIKPPSRPQQAKGINGCDIPPGVLTQFAIGERYDLHSMVTYLTQPECIEGSRAISATEMATEGMKFTATEPVNLLSLTKGLSARDYDSLRRLDSSLAKQFPEAIRTNPVSQNALLLLVGQLSLLSPQAARFGMVKLMEQEIYAADPVLGSSTASVNDKKQTAKELAQNLVRLGANEPVLISELASTVEDKAVLAQADSLLRLMRGLAYATEFDPTLVPTFNASAGALNRGVQKSKGMAGGSQGVAQNGAMLAALLGALTTSINGNERLDPGNGELNEAIHLLIEGQPLQATTLKKAWREILRVLAMTVTQTALADALAASLTPDMAFLPDVDRRLMLEAAVNYPAIGFAMQKQSVIAINQLQRDVKSGRITPQKYNEARARSLDPLISQILSWEAARIHPSWIRAVSRYGLLQDSDIEKKLPKHALTLFEMWDNASKDISEKSKIESFVAVGAQSFMLQWTLSQAYLPPLSKWVRKFESDAESDAQSPNAESGETEPSGE